MARTTWVKLAGLAAAMVLAAGTAACSEEPTPKHAAARPSPTVSPTPEKPRPPVMPAAAKKHTLRGALAFAKHFYKVVNYSSTTLDTGPLLALSAQDCVFCQDYIHTVDKDRRAGAKVTGGTYRIAHIKVIREEVGGDLVFDVRHQVVGSRQTIDRPGKKNDEVHEGNSPFRAYLLLAPAPSGWVVKAWGQE